MMRNCEIRAVYMRMIGNIADNVACMHQLIDKTKIDPRLKVKMLALSLNALTEVRDIYQEMIDALQLEVCDR